MEITFSSIQEALSYFDNDLAYLAFNLKDHEVEHPSTKQRYPTKELRVLKSYKFEEQSDADDVTLIHVFEAIDGIKGYFIDGSGMYSNF